MINIGKFKNRLNEKSYNNFGSEIVISRYNGCYDVDIYFPEYNWTAKNREYNNFKRGNVKCPYERTVFNIGYIGEIGEKINIKKEKSYEIWHNIMQRCYDKKYKDKHPAYKNCKVCEEWLNYTNFYKWYNSHYYEIPGYKRRMAIDKDILIKGNNLYSPDTCIFVPEDINIIFAKNSSMRGKYPIGVSYDKKNDKYNVTIRKYGKQYNLGRYDTIEESFQIYKYNKENYIKEVANLYKKWIPSKLYDAMCNYEVEMED